MTIENVPDKPLRIILIDTNPAGQKGSMAHYGDLVVEVLSGFSDQAVLEVTPVHLALSKRTLALFPSRMRSWVHHLWIIFSARSLLRKCKADIFHILDGSHAYVAGSLPRVPSVATSHDVIPALQAMGHFGNVAPSKTGKWLIARSLEGISKVDLIIADSKNTAADLGRVAGISRENILVVHLALPQYILREAAKKHIMPWSDRLLRSDSYILHVGNNAFYKNRIGVLRIFAVIHKACAVKLKMTGPKPTEEILGMVKDLALEGYVEFVVDPEDAGIAELYGNACLLLFPSLYEGFGWPPLEAMVMGCPVVCSSAASLPEIVGDAALICPPDDEIQMAQHCISVLSERELADDLVRKGYAQAGKFTLEKMGRELIAAYRDVINARSR